MMTPLRAKKTTSFFTPLLKVDSVLSANVRGSGAGSFLRQSASRSVRRIGVAASMPPFRKENYALSTSMATMKSLPCAVVCR